MVGDYISVLEEMGAERVAAFATSAVRDSSNGDAFIAELRERFALDAQILSGEEEARLTYLGATAGREVEERTLVLDIGGGSTELACGRGGDVDFHASLQVGTVRHTERHLLDDPPSTTELEELASDVRARIEEATADHPRPPPPTASPSPAPRLRSPRSTSSSTPTTPTGSMATGCR